VTDDDYGNDNDNDNDNDNIDNEKLNSSDTAPPVTRSWFKSPGRTMLAPTRRARRRIKKSHRQMRRDRKK
jgi:hypothetical protein